MKRIGFLAAFVGLLCWEQSEPSEVQIRTAFQSALNNPLHGIAIADRRARAGVLLPGGTTQLLALRKLGCVAAPLGAYVCDFFVELRAGDDTIRRTVSGYFLDGPGALTFAREVRAGDPPARSNGPA